MNPWQSIHNVVVAGLGITGLSVVNYLSQHSQPLSIKVIDTRSQAPGAESLAEHIPLHQGSWQTDWLLAADLIVLSPGIALSTPEIQEAIAHGVRVVGDIELFAWQVEKPVIAITGSNGKSTVTDLAGEVASACGVKVGVGGNIGVPALDLLAQECDLYVLELSSFQLETTSSLRLSAAAFLNLSEDHMDRYDSMADYQQAKQRIFSHAQACIVNQQDPATYPEQVESNRLVEFSLTEHTRYGLGQYQGQEWMLVDGEPVMASDDVALVGRHNLANVLVVMALLNESGIDFRLGLDCFKSYGGLTHRCQVVEHGRGVKWVNDSKATNVASTVAALSGLTLKGRLYLLVGGDGKGADFSELAEPLSSLNVQLCCFGRDGEQFMSLHPNAKQYTSMDEAISDLAKQLKEGDMVMLSPACASFDQYKNFMVRGDAFTALAHQYA